MVNENLIIENKKPVEIVQEVGDKYQVPSFEEFMETYESDGNLNYDDLNGGGIGEVKGYGPCSSCSGSNRNLTFKLAITLLNCIGDGKGCTVYCVDDAREQAGKIVAETGHWTNFWYSHFSQEDRRRLRDRINNKINYHKEGNSVDEHVCNKNFKPIDWEGLLENLEMANELIDQRFSAERGGRSSSSNFLD